MTSDGEHAPADIEQVAAPDPATQLGRCEAGGPGLGDRQQPELRGRDGGKSLFGGRVHRGRVCATTG